MKINYKLSIFLLFYAFLSTSCATLFTGTKSTIQFNSEPDGAIVEMDGLEIGVTPFTYNVKKSFDGILSFNKDGYQTKTMALPKSFNGVAILNLAGIVGWAVDFATGAIKKFDRLGLNPTLKEKN